MSILALPRDIQAFLDDYPDNDVEQHAAFSANLEFYLGIRRCEPDNLLIDEIHDRYGPLTVFSPRGSWLFHQVVR